MARANFLSTFFGKSVVAMVLALAIALTASEFKWNVVSTVFIFVFLIAAVVCVISFFFRAAKSSTAKTKRDDISDQKAERGDNMQHEPRSRETTNKPTSVLSDAGKVLMRRAVSGAVDAFLGGGTSSSSVRSKPSPTFSGRMAPEKPMTDETVNIEMQDLGGGAWKKMTTAPNNPAAIRVAFNNLVQEAASGRKLRAVGTQTGQLYDLR